MTDFNARYWKAQAELYKAQVPHLMGEAERYSRALAVARAWIATLVERGIADSTSGVEADIARVLAEIDAIV